MDIFYNKKDEKEETNLGKQNVNNLNTLTLASMAFLEDFSIQPKPSSLFIPCLVEGNTIVTTRCFDLHAQGTVLVEEVT